MEEAGLDVREDGMGSIYGRLAGTDPSAGALHMAFKDLCRSQKLTLNLIATFDCGLQVYFVYKSNVHRSRVSQ